MTNSKLTETETMTSHSQPRPRRPTRRSGSACEDATEALHSHGDAIVESVLTRVFAEHTDTNSTSKARRARYRKDLEDQLAHLGEAIGADNAALFSEYVAWAKVVLAQRGIGATDLEAHLGCLRDSLCERLPPNVADIATQFVATTIAEIPSMPSDLPSVLDARQAHAPIAHQYLAALLRGERRVASRLILDAVERGIPVREIYLYVFQPALHEIGRLWQTNRIRVAQEHYCSAATQLIMSQLYPRICSERRRGLTLVATCVAGDLHEIGARMVSDFFEMEGWDTYYIGANAPNEDIIQEVIAHRAEMLAISATLTSNVSAVRDLIAAIRKTPATSGVKVMVGGYPFNLAPDLWQKVGADGTAADAQGAIARAGEWFHQDEAPQ